MAVEVVAPTTASAGKRLAQFILAGPLVLLCSILIMGGGLLWVPPGAGRVNHIVLPIVFFPAIWCGLFFYACFDRQLWRSYSIVVGLIALHLIVIVR